MIKNSHHSVLVVDDEQNNFDVVEFILFTEGYELNYATSGKEALTFLETSQPDVILLDVMMPEMDGIEVCGQIKAHPIWRYIPIVIVTALNSKEDLARALNTGADDFISKPVSPVELRARVRSMLRIKQQHDALESLVKEKEALLEKQAASLQFRQDMSNMVVHDLRNPLTVIMMSSELLKRTNLPEKQLHKVQTISQSANRLQSLIDSLLMMAKLEAGKFLLNLTEVDLSLLGNEVVQDFQEIARKKKIDFVTNLPEPNSAVRIDEILLRRVIDNLLSNALKFSPENSQVTLIIEYASSSTIKIQVKDQGRGISEEVKQKIFDKYEIGNIISGVSQTGLGLAFCKIAVEAHGGKISVDSNEPNGSIFTIEIPTEIIPVKPVESNFDPS
jgi:two-component system, sensor histidine kinase and response regulator